MERDIRKSVDGRLRVTEALSGATVSEGSRKHFQELRYVKGYRSTFRGYGKRRVTEALIAGATVSEGSQKHFQELRYVKGN